MQHLIYRIFEVLPKIFLHHLFAHTQKRITKPIHQKNKLHCVVRFSDIVQRLKLTGKSLLHHQQHFLFDGIFAVCDLWRTVHLRNTVPGKLIQDRSRMHFFSVFPFLSPGMGIVRQ